MREDQTQEKRRRSFWAGYMGAVGLMGLIQDLLGKDLYLRLTRDRWTSGWITVPFEVGFLIWAVIVWRSTGPERRGD